MKKNRSTTINPTFTTINAGNWNFRNKSLRSVCSKPIVEMHLGNDCFVWKHEEILKLLLAYHRADLASIEMIKAGLAGEVKSYETPFFQKIKDFIRKEENKNNPPSFPLELNQEEGI